MSEYHYYEFHASGSFTFQRLPSKIARGKWLGLQRSPDSTGGFPDVRNGCQSLLDESMIGNHKPAPLRGSAALPPSLERDYYCERFSKRSQAKRLAVQADVFCNRRMGRRRTREPQSPPSSRTMPCVPQAGIPQVPWVLSEALLL